MMVILVLIALVSGIVCGQFIFSSELSVFLSSNSETILFLLMFLVGISIGMNRDVFKKIAQYHIKLFIIPVGIVAGTVLSGFICSFILDLELKYALPIVCGMGWYSLSGVMMSSMANASIGALTFISNLLREILSYICAPLVVKKLNKYTAIAPAAATSEDTLLSVLIKYTDEEVVVMAVFNGIVCSALVPILINFFFDLFA